MSKRPSDEYCTPRWLAERVGRFDLDPCSNDRSHIQCVTSYSIDKGEDGIGFYNDWRGRVWLNPPYSNPLPWMKKLRTQQAVNFCTESLVLVKLDTSTKWWKVLTSLPHDLWLFKKRIQFEALNPTSSNNFCSALVHYRGIDGKRLTLDDVATLYVTQK